MYESFGANVSNNSVTFRVFVPDSAVDPSQYSRGGSANIQSIRAVGDFQSALSGTNWDPATAPELAPEPHPHGQLFSLTLSGLPEGFYQYKYFVTFTGGGSRWVSDPCSKYGAPGDSENSAFAIGGSSLTAQPIAQRLPAKDLIVYELMIDDFTAEYRGLQAPVDAVHDKLDHLSRLGINAIEFMPWTAWPGSGFSWGYDPFQFFAAEYRYLNDASAPADKLVKLQRLINELHARNMHVIMDGVFNHVRAGINPNRGWGYRWLYENPDDSPFIGPFAGGGFFEEFDYRNRCTQQFISDVCLYWFKRFSIDGIRLDYTLGFYEPSDPSIGLAKLLSDVKAALAASNIHNASLFIEHLSDNRFEAIDVANRVGASGNWFDPFMFRTFEYARHGRADDQVLRILNSQFDYNPGVSPLTYIENHDHSTAVVEAGGRARWFKTQPSAILLLTSPGAAMIHNGQEFGEEYWLPGSGDGRVLPRQLRWNTHGSDGVAHALGLLYQKLCALRKQHPSLTSSQVSPLFSNERGLGIHYFGEVVLYERRGPAQGGGHETFVIAINYADHQHHLDIPLPSGGVWEDKLNSTQHTASVGGPGSPFSLRGHPINSNWGCLLYQAH